MLPTPTEDLADLADPADLAAAAGEPARLAADATGEEPRGCLYALSQPPLMLFLCVIGALLGAGAAWDLLVL